ncbi:hypothetical protein HOE04_05380 [archaeon]|jgi:hypothetical protein|nr:hypothetical protein [archaeon]
MNTEQIGKWALIAGLLVAILAAFVTYFKPSTILVTLFIIGLIIGFLNISQRETTSFLIAAIALLAVSGSLGALATLHQTTTNYLVDILSNFTAIISAAALVVSIKVVFKASKD